jgi:hypothetical protein
MPNTWAGVVAWAQAHPTLRGKNWSGWCEAFVADAGLFNYSFNSAKTDCEWARNHGKLIPRSEVALADVPVGWLVLWDFAPDGHVAFKAPDNRLLMASKYVTDPIHPSLGYISAPHYDDLTGHNYAGATPYHNVEHLSGIQLTPNDPNSGGDGGTTVLSADDKTWITSAIASGVNNKIDDITIAVWHHLMNSAVDGSSHMMQTYVGWTQRDAAAIVSAMATNDPARILAKEASSASIYSINAMAGTKRHITPGQWTVLQALGMEYDAVPDGSLDAFTTIA